MTTQPASLDAGAMTMTDEQILEHFEMPGLNLAATLDAHDLGLLLTGIRALLSASKPAAGQRWKLVPVEPTSEMVCAARVAMSAYEADEYELKATAALRSGVAHAATVIAEPVAYLSTDPKQWGGSRIKPQGTFTIPVYLHPAEQAQSGEKVYAYIYEYDTAFGLHRQLEPGTYNGANPTRTVKVYAAPQSANKTSSEEES